MSEQKPEQPAPRFKPFPEQDENGVDLSLIRENLRLTPIERLRKADRAWRDMLRLRGLALRKNAS